jgi:hypothetical protein
MNMTPLEIALWATVYAKSGPTYPIELADTAVEELRERLEKSRRAELLAEAKTVHQTRVVMSKRHGAELQTVRCSCGYDPQLDDDDVEEMMSLHLAMVKAQGPDAAAAAGRVEDRLVLWGHLVSAHAGIFPLQATLEELLDMHEHEHNGPGTIRNRPRESREYSLNKIGNVLSESER